MVKTRYAFLLFFFFSFGFSPWGLPEAQAVDCTSDYALRDSVFQFLSNYIQWIPFQPYRSDNIRKMECSDSTPFFVPQTAVVQVDFNARADYTTGKAICHLNVFRSGTPDAGACYQVDFYRRGAQDPGGIYGLKQVGHYDGKTLERYE